MGARPRLLGREDERQHLLAALDHASSGQPRAVLVHGEPGIGKSSLVREVADTARDRGFHVLFGHCLRFGADVTSYVPFIQALNHWLHTAPSVDRDRVLPGTATAAQAVPALLNPESGLVLFQLGSLIESLQRDRPTVLVLDDLQWSDPSSLDVLLYVIAGFTTGQRLAVVGTFRDTDLVEGHRLHGWLADVFRMPCVEGIPLNRLDLWDVEQLVVLRNGAASRAVALVEEIYHRSGGNPYLVELLALDAAAVHGSTPRAGVPLGEALLTSWHRLSPVARRVTQLVAVSGRPVDFTVLRDLAGRRGVQADSVAAAVAEAAAQGITVEDGSGGGVWFRHPLLAEVVTNTLRPWELTELHRDYAEIWLSAPGVSSLDRATHLALHHASAEQPRAAFIWSLRAAEEAAAVHAQEEEATHLSRAVNLLPLLPHAATADIDVVALQIRAAGACDSAGDYRAAVQNYDAALAHVDPSQDPRMACRILLALHFLRDQAGMGSGRPSLSEPRQALELVDELPPCAEHVMALAHLAYAEVFNGLDTAVEHAAAAVTLGEKVDAAGPLSWALTVRAQTRWGTNQGICDAERGFELAQGERDNSRLMRATVGLSNSYQSAGRYVSAAALTEGCYRVLRDRGSQNEAAVVGSIAAQWNLALGRWDRVRPMVREMLHLARSDSVAASVRCKAAVLAAHQGETEAARMHLRRAAELMPTSAAVGDDLIEAEMEVYIALGEPSRALELAAAHMTEAVQIDPITADEFLQLAARAAANQAEQVATAGERHSVLARLERIEAIRGHEPPRFQPAGSADAVHPALGALYEAQRAQCQNSRAELAKLWAAASEATERADMRYEHARARYFLARVLLGQRRERREATKALEEAREVSVDLGARPLTQAIDDLAAQAHLQMETPSSDHATTQPSVQGDGVAVALTPREREILQCLVAGKTYAQIAARLFISEKTVSTHVSNLLRKTGTTSRIELAARTRAFHNAPEP